MVSRSVILCVDDDKLVLSALSEQLVEWFGKSYTIEKALSGEEALMIIDDVKAEGNDVSVVVSDYIMPNMKGDELLEKINQKDHSIRKIMLTGYAALDGIVHAINKAGLYRFLSKPWDKKDLMLTLLEAIKSFEAEKNSAKLAASFKSLYQEYETQYVSNLKKFENTMMSIMSVLDARSLQMIGHSARVRDLSVAIGEAMGLSKEDMRVLTMAALIHDIDKIRLNDTELEKRVNETEISEADMQVRVNAVANIVTNMPDGDKIVKAAQYIYENFDGTGLNKTAGNNIPVVSRIISAANFYDTAVKIAKKQRDMAVNQLIAGKGTMFDPQVVDFLIDKV